MEPVIEVRNLERFFGDFQAVKGISFEVKPGEVFGLLGPNGAGKSTTIKMLVTLLKPTRGEIRLNGYDLLTQQALVRGAVGIIFQDPSLDERLTASENLYFHAQLYHVPGARIKERIETALKVVDLTERRNDLVMNFSGGMKRRLEIARGILHTPRILFLDEPTIGLDPQTRRHIWRYLQQLREREAITIFLTTHYMDEAEICDRIAIMDHGEIIALDTPANLKRNVSGEIINLKVAAQDQAIKTIEEEFGITPSVTGDAIRLTVENGAGFLPKLFEVLGQQINGIDIKKPTLEDVFIKMTGREIRETEASSTDKLRDMVRRRGRK